MSHGFNHQSLYRQPGLNLRSINQVVWNGTNNKREPSNDSAVGGQNLNGFINGDRSNQENTVFTTTKQISSLQKNQTQNSSEYVNYLGTPIPIHQIQTTVMSSNHLTNGRKNMKTSEDST